MHCWTTLALLAALAAPVAEAKHPKKMADTELVMTLGSPDSSQKRKEQAAEEIGERRVEGAIPALVEACDPREHEFVCSYAVDAIARYRTPEAHEALSTLVLDERLDTFRRQKALRVLERENQTMLGAIAPQALANFRNLAPPFAKNLVQGLVAGNNRKAMDLTILIARDVGTARPVRVAALEAAETFNHPRLYEAYADLLGDEDPRIRIKCVQGLDRAGLPPLVVRPPLLRVAENDDKGNVRTQAWKALRNFGHPSMLPVLNRAVLNEPNIVALGHVLALFSQLADASSIPAIEQILRNNMYTPEYRIELVHTLVRIGDPSVLPTLEYAKGNSADISLTIEIDKAIKALQGPEAARIELLAGFPVLDVRVVDDSATYEEPPPLSVTVGADGRVDLSGLGVSASVSASEQGASATVQTPDGGASVEVDAGED